MKTRLHRAATVAENKSSNRSDARSPSRVLRELRAGNLNPDDPAVTIELLRLDAVVGLTEFFDASNRLESIGIQCALCHSVVDDSVAPGVGRRLDGSANRDLNVGAIIALAPRLEPMAALLGVPVPTVREVLGAWGPGKFDAELLLDGKGLRYPIAARERFGHVRAEEDLITPALAACISISFRSKRRVRRKAATTNPRPVAAETSSMAKQSV